MRLGLPGLQRPAVLLRLVVVLTTCAVTAAGCSRKPAPTVTEQAPPAPREWPQGRAAPVKITDALILSIPLQYERSAIDPKAPAANPQSFTHKEAQFDFFLPGFTGYTLQNFRNDFDENKVEVVYLHAGDPHEADPDAPGEYPPNMLKRSLTGLLDPKDYKDMYGLRCYRGRVQTNRLTCYGRRDQTTSEDIMLTAPVPPYPEGVTFPQVQARYFSKRYGGVRIAWRTHMKNLPRWQEIDAQIWKLVDEWNVAPRAPAAAPEGATPGPAAAPGAAKPAARGTVPGPPGIPSRN
jgi:hypothetical protein